MAIEPPPTAPTDPAGTDARAEGQARARAAAEAQGTLGTSTFENLFGAGKDLWDGPEDFERFMELLREQRAKG